LQSTLLMLLLLSLTWVAVEPRAGPNRGKGGRGKWEEYGGQ
jgi:hypothetical protein